MKRLDKFIDRLHKHETNPENSMSGLKQMLYEKVDDLMKEEMLSEEEAIDKTIEDFGDESDYHFQNMDKEQKRHKRQKTIRHYRNDLLFASIATVLIAAIVITINYVMFEDFFPWVSIIIILGVMFWPLSLLYKFLNKKGE